MESSVALKITRVMDVMEISKDDHERICVNKEMLVIVREIEYPCLFTQMDGGLETIIPLERGAWKATSIVLP